jgi:glycosyltransferase involved in cell wall biosynthesis
VTPRCLHVVENLDRGAVETWLVRALGHARAHGRGVDWTFYCALGRPGRLDDEARALGARVVLSPAPIGAPRAFVRALRAELRRGRYDVLHAHHDLVSAVYFVAALGLPIRRRIVHVHNADEAVLTPNALKQAIYRPVFRRVCLAAADRVAGISAHTLATFTRGRRRPGVDAVLPYGIDARAFTALAPERDAVRRELGLAADARILLFAGRMAPEKNPVFAVDVLRALRAIDARAVAVFAGTGSLERDVAAALESAGLAAYGRQLGWRDDVARLMAASDCFILPHVERPLEGFGIAVVEAQLAGLPLLLSTGVADDPLLPAARAARLPLGAGAGVWAEAAARLMTPPLPSREAALAALAASPMDMDRALDGLLALHA